MKKSYNNSVLKRIMMMRKLFLLPFVAVLVLGSSIGAHAQFEKSSFHKVPHSKRQVFQRKYIDHIKQTGRGLYQNSRLDTISTNKLRARLQKLFGDPTVTIKDLIYKPNFRPGMAIEFEYWFVVDEKYPLLVLDSKGPFGKELVYTAASRYIDLMPQIMRDFTKMLYQAKPAPFMDYYYAADKEKWYKVQYKDGKYLTKHIQSPPNMTYHTNR
jgi:hypothetical protein